VPEQAQVITPLNNDPFIGMLETPVTSAPIVRPRPLAPAPACVASRVSLLLPAGGCHALRGTCLNVTLPLVCFR
jgi:hypothetical protein